MLADSIKQFRFLRQQSRKGSEQREVSKARLGLAQRTAEDTSNKMRQAAQRARQESSTRYDPAARISEWMDEMEDIQRERQQRISEKSTTGALQEDDLSRPRPMHRPGSVNYQDLNERDLLARTLMAEAGGEGARGMTAAGAVILNRVNAQGFQDTLRDVILAPGQFSAWNKLTGYARGEGGLDMDSIRPSEAAYRVADQLLSGDYVDETGGATHYYNPSVATPRWGREAGGTWKQIGAHIFGFAN